MKGLYGDPKGENILKNTSEMSKLESESSETKMKRRIKELEDEVKVCWLAVRRIFVVWHACML